MKEKFYSIIKPIFNTQGRYNRTEYIIHIFMVYFLFMLTTQVCLTLFGVNAPSIIAIIIFSLIYIISHISATVRRVHDLGYSSYYCILLYVLKFIPVLNLIPFIMLTFFKGTNGPNAYGYSPIKLNKIRSNI